MGRMTDNQRHIALIRDWLQRKHAKGEYPNADQVWKQIKRLWPTLDEETQEQIFRNAYP